MSFTYFVTLSASNDLLSIARNEDLFPVLWGDAPGCRSAASLCSFKRAVHVLFYVSVAVPSSSKNLICMVMRNQPYPPQAQVIWKSLNVVFMTPARPATGFPARSRRNCRCARGTAT